MGCLHAFVACRSGSAAAETVLVLPVFLGLIFGAFDLGNYFLREHVVVGAVREGARFAARQPRADVACDGVAPATELAIKRATRLIDPVAEDLAANRRISYWDDDSTVTVSVTCVDNVGFAGLYDGVGELPRIQVEAVVGYRSIFSSLGLADLTLNIRARSEAAVVGA